MNSRRFLLTTLTAELLVLQPRPLGPSIKLETAEAFGLPIPPAQLARVDQMIE